MDNETIYWEWKPTGQSEAGWMLFNYKEAVQ